MEQEDEKNFAPGNLINFTALCSRFGTTRLGDMLLPDHKPLPRMNIIDLNTRSKMSIISSFQVFPLNG